MAMNIAQAANQAATEKSIGKTHTYFRIGELAREFGVSLRTLRFYEDKGLLRPRRRGATRLYTEHDKALLRLVLLGRRIGFPLRDVKHIVELYNPKGPSVGQLKLVLQMSEQQMERLERQYREIEAAVTDLTTLISDIRARLVSNGSARPPQSAAS